MMAPRNSYAVEVVELTGDGASDAVVAAMAGRAAQASVPLDVTQRAGPEETVPERRLRALFTGDVLVTWPRIEAGWKGLTTDTARNRRSLSELATVGDIGWVGTGHGPPLTDDAAAKVRRVLAGGR